MLRTRLNAAERGISSVSVLIARTNSTFIERNAIFLESITCDTSINTMDHPDFIVCSFTENVIVLKRVTINAIGVVYICTVWSVLLLFAA